MTSAQLKSLAAYSACDVSDALLKLNVPGAGFLADITPIPTSTAIIKTIAKASTFLFVPKASGSFAQPPSATPFQDLPEPNITPGTPYADLATPDTVVVLSQPAGQKCAVMGGIMAVRMKKLGVKGVVVDGRVRDLGTCGEVGIPVWSKATSTIGAGAESKPWARDVPVVVGGVRVEAGDIIMIDPAENGVVSIPQSKLEEVLELLPKLVAADENVIVDVENGGTVADAFKEHRSNL
ncbi:RraA-like protein [Lophium mytilinum]|uniref:RraA-like protein n=1 Tax=Lophium mytilinum TaxID=390894 RepID=A0A6A6QN26_9PEZI|nr:RraA-like protein [Lophium mytilinum]